MKHSIEFVVQENITSSIICIILNKNFVLTDQSKNDNI